MQWWGWQARIAVSNDAWHSAFGGAGNAPTKQNASNKAQDETRAAK